MKTRKIFLVVFIFSLLNFTTKKLFVNKASIKITPLSSLLIKGTTNINSFTFKYNVQSLHQPILINYLIDDKMIKFKSSSLILNNIDFTCEKKGMNNDLQTLLKSKTHPQISLTLQQVNISKDTVALVNISMAGVTKNYQTAINYEHYKQHYTVDGKLSINLKDFQIKTPKKFFGLVTINDKIDLIFHLALTHSPL